MKRTQIEDGFDVSELDKFSKSLIELANKTMPKETNKFLRKEGSKLQRKTKSIAKKRVKKKTGNYIKSIKRGRPYKYRYGKDERAIRVYSSAPHSHLVEDGHILIEGGKKGKGGKEIGFVKGKHVFKTASKEFETTFYKDTENFIDDVLEKGL